MWSTRASGAVYENTRIRVREDQVLRPDGQSGVYGVVEVRSPAVSMVAITEADEVLLAMVARAEVRDNETLGALLLALVALGRVA